MAKTSIYLNFDGNAEEAFHFYKKIFNSEFSTPIVRMGDMGSAEGMPPLSEKEKNMVMHVALPILGGVEIMATDMLESMGHKLRIGNNTTINLQPDSREEVDRIYKALADGGSETMPPQDMPWAAYWATCLDRYGIRWMFSCSTQNQ